MVGDYFAFLIVRKTPQVTQVTLKSDNAFLVKVVFTDRQTNRQTKKDSNGI